MKNRFWWNIAMGAGDGVVIPFLFAATLAGAGVEPLKIFYVALVALVAATLIVSITSSLSSKEQTDQFDVKKYNDEVIEREWETEDSRMAILDLNRATREQAKEEFREEKKRWRNFIERFELNQASSNITARQNAVTIGLAYFLSGLFVIHSFFFISNLEHSFYFGLCLVVVITGIVAIIKSNINKESFLPLFAYTEIILLAAIGAAYLAGKFFH